MSGSFRRLLRNLRRSYEAENLKIGDIIRTTTPMNCDAPYHRAGDHLRIQLDTQAAVEEARDLIASGRWMLESEPEDGGDDEPQNH